VREVTIPILPCRSIDETLEFYGALGFEVTYRQRRPNSYAVVQRGGIVLHFFVLRDLDPAGSYGTCYVRVDDVDSLHTAFTAGLKAAFGRVPARGIPRIGAVRDLAFGVRQFIVTDPGGNAIRIGKPIGPEHADEQWFSKRNGGDRFERAVEAATLLVDSKGDYAAAARVLDKALERTDSTDGPHLARALLLRADIAVATGQPQRARADLERVRALREQAHPDDLRRADELASALGQAESA
jgi:catechol 2,3-dioxygenase-like lactoylglutathione lyase family enzyme